MPNKHVNAVVVGSGAGGGVVAKELSTAGLTVVLFERGDWAKYDDHTNDELTSQRIPVLGYHYGPDERHPRVNIDIHGNKRTVLPHEGGYNGIAACVGSGTVSYAAMAWRFKEEDFKMKSTYGHVEGSTIADWPISYEDLEPYYEKAEWEIGVSGDDAQNPFSPWRKRPHPMPPFEHNRLAKLLDTSARKIGYHPFPIPMLRNSVPYRGRPACIRMRTCNGFACPVNAKGGSQNTVIPVALESGNCELRVNSQVAEILTNDKGKVTGVSYFDGNNKKQVQTADIVIVSGSATETPRLLLNSKSKHFPEGIGNRYDWVGRNLQGHAYCGATGLFEDEVYDDVGPGSSIAASDFTHNNPGVVGGGNLTQAFPQMPYSYSNMRPPGSFNWGKEHKDFQRRYYRRTGSINGAVQEIPKFENRVEVTNEVRDFWGIPVCKTSGSKLDIDIETAHFIADKAEKWLQAAGAFQTWKSIPGKGVGGQHQAGTCRMGDDPQTSVTNKYGQIHGVDNLFVADGSLHVTNAGFNPALTIMALGYWVSDHIVKEWMHGNHFK